MKILVDADACPVKSIIEAIASEFKIPVVMVTDSSHVITSEYSKIVTVSRAKDSADIALINMTEKGDIVITQDYGVASMALGRGAYAIGNSGLLYTAENIDRLMFERFLSGKIRRSGKKLTKADRHKKRTRQDDEMFEKNFKILCEKISK